VAHARQFSWNRTAEGILAVYDEAAEVAVGARVAALNGSSRW
jgi:hypothetical protein